MTAFRDVSQSVALRSAALKIDAPLRCTLRPTVGPMPSWMQSAPVGGAAAQTVVDGFGILRAARPAEALFWGARRVENLLRYSEHLSNTGTAKWETINGLTVAPVEDVTRPGIGGNMTAWKISRAASVSSVIRTQQLLRRRDMPAGLDLLAPVPHFFGINLRQSTSNVVSTVELQAYVSGGGPTVSKTITIDGTMRTYGLVFTPAAPKRITGLSWASSVLTVTCPSHGYAAGNNIRLSGSLPSAFDADTTVATVVDANTFTVSMASNPGAATSFGWTQYGYRIALSPGSFASTAVGDIEVEHPYVSEYYGYPVGYVPEYVPQDAFPPDRYWYGAAVDGVQYFDSAPGWTYNATSGLVTRGGGAALTTCRGLATYAQAANLVPRKHAEFFAGWTKADASMTVTDLADVSPLGFPGAARIVEGTHTGRHYVEIPAGLVTASNTADGKLVHLSVFMSTPGGTSGRDWAVLSVTDRAGAEQHAYVNLASGAVGTKSSGIKALSLEPLATLGGLAWYRVHVRVLIGTGTTAPVIRIGLASGDATNSYAGGGTRYLVAWGADFAASAYSDRPTAAPYGRAHHESIATRAGSRLTWHLGGMLGLSDFAVQSTYTPYFDHGTAEGTRAGWGGISYIDCGGPQIIAGATATAVSYAATDRVGLTTRGAISESADNHMRKFAFDMYRTPDPAQYYRFQAGHAYSVGDAVVPTDTRTNNLNARNVWRVKVAGTSGAEPTWPAVLSLPSADVVSGTVTFVCDHDNGINGRWEPYDGAHILPPEGFMAEARTGWFMTNTDYGVWVNGSAATKQTWPNPVNPSGYAMAYPPQILHFGQMQTGYGADIATLTPYLGTDGAGLLPSQTTIHKGIKVWSGTGMPTSGLAQLTA